MESMDTGDDSSLHRLVHLDLKGAPPRVSYLEKIFPLFSKLGATGLLVEYEDMFPYQGDTDTLAAPNAYSIDEIECIQKLAAANNLIVIPLVQTFGHFEFVLKHEKYKHLREVERYPMALCPLHPDTLPLLTSMLDQVIKLHPDSQWFHIGADEVFHMGLCERCQELMREKDLNPAQFFFRHIQQILTIILEKHPGVQFIMWDDMFRDADLNTLKTSGVTDLVAPMIWQYYNQALDFPQGMFKRYAEVFSGVWIASAFKGATGVCKMAIDINHHVQNHLEWLKVIKSQILPVFKKFHGACLTGWQRYDHYSVLCELLPVGLPSLAACLLTLTNGHFTAKVQKQASDELNFVGLMPLDPYKQMERVNCEFPGSNIYSAVHILINLNGQYQLLLKNERMTGWMTSYHIRHKFCNPAHVDHFFPEAQRLLRDFQQVEAMLSTLLSEVFYSDCVKEWLECNISGQTEKLRELVNTAFEQLSVGAKPKVATGLSSDKLP